MTVRKELIDELLKELSWLLPSSVPFSERMREVARTGGPILLA